MDFFIGRAEEASEEHLSHRLRERGRCVFDSFVADAETGDSLDTCFQGKLLPSYLASPSSSSSMARRRLYLAIRSERFSEPVLICPAAVPIAKSAMKESSVSPERC
jgi:hypothetical protein